MVGCWHSFQCRLIQQKPSERGFMSRVRRWGADTAESRLGRRAAQTFDVSPAEWMFVGATVPLYQCAPDAAGA